MHVDLPVPCSFDFNVAATKYFYGLEGGEVPLAFLFSGTVFYRDADDFLQMEQIPWSKEAEYRLSGERLAGDDGALLPGQRPGCASTAPSLTASIATSAGAITQLG